MTDLERRVHALLDRRVDDLLADLFDAFPAGGPGSHLAHSIEVHDYPLIIQALDDLKAVVGWQHPDAET